MTNIRIAITLPETASVDQALWGSGLVQNAVFLYRTLDLIPGVKPYTVGNYPVAKKLGLRQTHKGPGYLDAVIEVGAKLDPRGQRALRDAGGTLIHHVAGNTMMLNLESIGGSSANPDLPYGQYDAVWLLPHTVEMNLPYYQLLYGGQVLRAPVVWSPEFLPKDFGWRPDDAKRGVVACFEPSVSVVKTPHMALLIAEECQRLDPNEPFIKDLRVFATTDQHLRDPSFRSMIARLQAIAKHISFQPRTPAAQAYQGLSAVILHQWHNELNYVMWESLYGGYPLVHNSTMVQAGYPMGSFTPKQGGYLLRSAIEQHADTLDQYRAIAHGWTSAISPQNVAPKYEELLKLSLRRST